MANALDNLKKQLADTMSAYNLNRATILEKALKDGGSDAVNKLEQENDAIRDAYFEILRAQLDENNTQYETLTQTATDESANLQTSIKQLNSINEIIDISAKVISAIGRILITLAK